ncbi:MAG: aldehyde ferredoxin oxidoreductase N-terminal domain-containing protein [Myxococcota bacterium]
MKGSFGKVLKVDLSSGEISEISLPEEDYRRFVGGSGLAAKWFFDSRSFEKPPLSPESPLIIMNGPLAGTPLAGSSRLEICGRSPLTGIWGESSIGGHFCPQLKGAGYDGIIVVGASEKPVYLLVTDEKVEIRDASHLWGVDTYETETKLKEEVGDKRCQVLGIGPAGENLVKYACVINDRGSAAGRCGMGAVMGSKKLKAVVARGKKKTPIADERAFKQARSKALECIRHSLVADGLKSFGSNVHMEYGMAIGDVPTKNWRQAYWDKGPAELGSTPVTPARSPARG